MQEPLETYSSEHIMNTPLTPLPFIVYKLMNVINQIMKQAKTKKQFCHLIGDREHAATYNSMISKREQEIAGLEQRIKESREFDAVSRRKHDELKSTAALIEKMLTEPKISDANLRLLLRMVYVHQNEDKTLDVRFEFNGAFEASYVTWVDTEQTAR